jgi:hypothetical protein
MHKVVPVSEVNRRTNAEQLVTFVSTRAPFSEAKKCPVVHTFLRQENAFSGYTLVAETLTEETSAELALPHLNKDRAEDTLTYLRGQLQSCGIETVDREDQWLAMKASSRTTS